MKKLSFLVLVVLFAQRAILFGQEPENTNDSGLLGDMKIATNILFLTYVGKPKGMEDKWVVPITVGIVNLSDSVMTWKPRSVVKWRYMDHGVEITLESNFWAGVGHVDENVLLQPLDVKKRADLLGTNDASIKIIEKPYLFEMQLPMEPVNGQLERWQNTDFMICWEGINIYWNGDKYHLWLKKRIKGKELIQKEVDSRRAIGERRFWHITKSSHYRRQE